MANATRRIKVWVGDCGLDVTTLTVNADSPFILMHLLDNETGDEWQLDFGNGVIREDIPDALRLMAGFVAPEVSA